MKVWFFAGVICSDLRSWSTCLTKSWLRKLELPISHQDVLPVCSAVCESKRGTQLALLCIFSFELLDKWWALRSSLFWRWRVTTILCEESAQLWIWIPVYQLHNCMVWYVCPSITLSRGSPQVTDRKTWVQIKHLSGTEMFSLWLLKLNLQTAQMLKSDACLHIEAYIIPCDLVFLSSANTHVLSLGWFLLGNCNFIRHCLIDMNIAQWRSSQNKESTLTLVT